MAAYGLGAIENLEVAALANASAVEVTPNLEQAKFYHDEFVAFWRTAVPAV